MDILFFLVYIFLECVVFNLFQLSLLLQIIYFFDLCVSVIQYLNTSSNREEMDTPNS